MKKTRSNKNRRGFTLIEVMLVLVIISTIAGLSVVAVIQTQKRAYMRAAEAKISALDEPLKMYALDVGDFPMTEDGLDALYQCPSSVDDPSKWGGKYIEEPIALDPWGMPYQYEYPGSNSPDTYDLWSFGPDKINGTEDDITSWIQQ